MKSSSLLALCIFLLNGVLLANIQFKIIEESPQILFAVKTIESKPASSALNIEVEFRLTESLSEQSFSIESQQNKIIIEGGDHNGLMYGGLELAELIDLEFDLSSLSIQKSPTSQNRGIKFNIPLDARCPSYDDTGDAAQKNIANMWDYSFWTGFLDNMALHRYNVLSLWSPNPFQVMLKLPEYPDLALDDICVTTVVPNGKVGEWDDAGGVNDTVLNNLKVVKKISIDNKITFWQNVFNYAESRGIDIYFFSWNIYTNGTYGKYGLTEDIDNPKTVAYYRQAIKVFLETYPQIAGIGVTAGERMHVPQGKNVADEREKWLWNTYGLGIMDYKKTNPDREIRFIHRVWYSKFEDIMKYWDEYPDPFDVGYKYVKARIYSSPNESPFIGGLKKSLIANHLKCWWNLRNDDIYVYRWGDPDYVREFLSNLPKDVTAGYHMGPDGYVFGRVFADKEPTIKGSLEIDKHWYKFMLWGRLGYDNKIQNSYIEKLLAKRYNIEDSRDLFKIWQSASKIVPQINRFMFHTGDRHWSPEMCSSRESFKFTHCFRMAKPMPGNSIVNPKKYFALKNAGNLGNRVTPLQISDSLLVWSNYVLQNINKVPKLNKELESIKGDLEAFAWLGSYYANKILAANYMEEIANTDVVVNKDALSATMQNATDAWFKYSEISDKNYSTQMYSRVNMMDWKFIESDVTLDQKIVEETYSTKSLSKQLKNLNEALSISHPYKGVRKWVNINSDTSTYAEIALYDNRGELINYYKHPCSSGNSILVWEDLTWMPKGEYTMVLNIDNRTAFCMIKL